MHLFWASAIPIQCAELILLQEPLGLLVNP
jgi:hypothetical protein